MMERYVTAPDGTEWVIGRKFLFGASRYPWFRFGRDGGGGEPRRLLRMPAAAIPGDIPLPPAVPSAPPEAIVTRSRPPDWAPGLTSDPARRRGSYRHTAGTIRLPAGVVAAARPWVIEAREHRDQPRVLGWSVTGRQETRTALVQVAQALAAGLTPAPSGAYPVSVLAPSPDDPTPHPTNTSWPPTIS